MKSALHHKLLPIMARMGRNSLLTQQVCQTLSAKLDDAEGLKFQQWLQVVEQDQLMAVKKANRNLRRF